ncbi:MAG: FtsX-like permease family protein [Bacteroidales bacterium]|nr:FtsX-like permease family protein [Bacteroidales bacterium]
MVKHYFTVAIRNLFKNKIQSLLNIICLAIGMVSVIIIFNYSKFESTYDNFYKDTDKIFRVEYNTKSGDVWSYGCTYHTGPFGPLLKAEYPEISEFTRIYQNSNPVLITYKEEKSLIKSHDIHWVDQGFLTIFDCLFLKGVKKNALSEPNTVVLTESTANKYFGKEDPIGKSILVDREQYRVTGVCADPPSNTHFHYKYLFSLNTLINRTAWMQVWDRGAGFYTYVKFGSDINKVDMENKMLDVFHKHLDRTPERDDVGFEYKLRPITDIHLHCHFIQELEKNSDIKLIWFIFIFGIFILLITIVNAINLVISNSLNRAKEVGVRKVVGGHKSQLIYQFLIEHLLINVLAMIIALTIFLISPMFVRHIFSSYIFSPIDILKDGWIWGLIIILLSISTILSGIYPALVLSSFKPISVLRGKLSTSKIGILMRKGLIIFQFMTALALVATVITINKQFSFMQTQDLGFNKDQILIVNGPRAVADSTLLSSLSFFKEEVSKLSTINNITISNIVPGIDPSTYLGANLYSDQERVRIGIFSVDYSFIETYNMELLAGRSFDENFRTDFRSIMISESVSKELGFVNPEDAIGQELDILLIRVPIKIIGVLADFHQLSLDNEYTPVGMLLNIRTRNYVSVNINMIDVENTISDIEDLWKNSFPNDSYSYYFLDSSFDQQYSNYLTFGRLIQFFTIVVLIISFLGLWALSTNSILLRTKEVAIRKVYFASPLNIVWLLIKYYYILILIAAVITLPIAYHILNNWLINYAFRISIAWWFFVIPILVVTIITILTVGYGIFKVSNKNLAETLKYE